MNLKKKIICYPNDNIGLQKYLKMSRAVIKLSTTSQQRENALHEVVSQMDRITGYFSPDGTLGHDHMPSQSWHKRGYSHEGELQQWEQKLASLLG